MLVTERLLHGMPLVAVRQTFQRGHGAVRCGGRKHCAGLHRLAVEEHGARTARRRVATDVRRSEPETVAQQVHEQRAVLDVDRALLAVDGQGQVHARASSIARHTRSDVVGMSMCRTPRWATASTTAFCTAGVAPMVPASPMPLTPSGFSGLRVAMSTSSKSGSSAALGNA